jgi:hypothetical protein
MRSQLLSSVSITSTSRFERGVLKICVSEALFVVAGTI